MNNGQDYRCPWCGLGACTRLQQFGNKNWTMIEKSDFNGGLATTVLKDGFSWDLDTHFLFSHYNYYSDLVDQGLLAYAKLNGIELSSVEDLWLQHKRQAYIRNDTSSWIPYPFQNNFFKCKDQRLIEECFDGLVDVNQNPSKKPLGELKNFQDNLSAQEIKIADSGWGPNVNFKYPKYGGNGAIWNGVGSLLDKQNVKLNTEVAEIDIEQKLVKFYNSPSIHYDI